jgi:hypothetical protein
MSLSIAFVILCRADKALNLISARYMPEQV